MHASLEKILGYTAVAANALQDAAAVTQTPFLNNVSALSLTILGIVELLLIRELAQKPHKPHAAFWHCAKPHAEIKSEVTEKLSQWRDTQVERQVLVREKVALLSQLLRAGHEKCVKSEWSQSDGWTNRFPSSRIDQILIWMNTVQCDKDLRV
ncbi:hypothetical protein K438DRAFT_1937561 [Mycena galopus ATCC 62051]|nr:hypothetical protein K438DRAFT_1937561 [Mycena galopus ATCC 62051]